MIERFTSCIFTADYQGPNAVRRHKFYTTSTAEKCLWKHVTQYAVVRTWLDSCVEMSLTVNISSHHEPFVVFIFAFSSRGFPPQFKRSVISSWVTHYSSSLGKIVSISQPLSTVGFPLLISTREAWRQRVGSCVTESIGKNTTMKLFTMRIIGRIGAFKSVPQYLFN